jgi:hypothetical protein
LPRHFVAFAKDFGFLGKAFSIHVVHGVIMRLTLVALLLFSLSQSQPPGRASKTSQSNQQQLRSTEEQPTADIRGTEKSPLIVKTIPPVKTQAELEQEARDRNAKATNDNRIVILTGILAFIGFLQTLVFGYQAYKLRQTVESSGEQAEAMERHIGEAARSATAMEKIATTIQTGNQAVMRAYLSVVVGTGIYQERRVGQGDLKFEGKPNLVNTGNTPARKVRIRSNAAVLPLPPPENFDYPLPAEPTETASSSVGAHQTYILSCLVKDFVPDSEVAAIKEGAGKSLYIWGLVTYEDIFGETHKTKFGQWLTWLPDGKVLGYYIPGQNDVD